MSDPIIPNDDPIVIPPNEGGTFDGLYVGHLRFQDLGMLEIEDENGDPVEIPNMPTTVTMKPMTSDTGFKARNETAYRLSGNLAVVSQYVPEVKTAFDNFTADLVAAIPAWKAWEDAKNSPELPE